MTGRNKTTESVANTALSAVLAVDSDARLERITEYIANGVTLDDLLSEAEAMVLQDLGEAGDAARLLVQVADKRSDPAVRARARRVLGHCLAYANRLDQALAVLNDANQLAETSGDAATMGKVGLARLHVLNRLGRGDEALAAGQEALRSLQAAGLKEPAARARVNIGIVLRMKGDPALALEHFSAAREEFASEPMIAAQIDSNSAEALLDLNQFAEAEQLFRQALEAFRTADARRAMAIVLGNLADVMNRQGKLDSALRHFEEARRLMNELDSPGDAARLLAEECEVHVHLGMIDEAIELLPTALEQLDDCGLIWEAARARSLLGHLHLTRGALELAEPLFDASRSAFAQRGDTVRAARVQVLQSLLASRRGEHTSAIQLIRRALSSFQHRPADEAAGRLALAEVYSEASEPQEALTAVEQGLRCAQHAGVVPLQASLFDLRGWVESSLGREDHAIAAYRQAVDCIERIHRSLQADQFRTSLADDRNAVYGRLVGALCRTSEPQLVREAFNVAERARSRGLLELMARTVEAQPIAQAGDSVESQLVAEIRSAGAELNGLLSRIHDPTPSNAETDGRALRDRIATLEHRIRRAQHRLSATQPAPSVFAPPIECQAVQELLEEGAAVLEYFFVGDELMIFVVRRSGLTVRRANADANVILEAVERFRFQIQRERVHHSTGTARHLLDDVRYDLKQLYEYLIEPIAEDLAGADHLHIVPHRALHALSFAALWNGHAHLLERFDITYSPSASILQYLPATFGSAEERRAVVFGYSDTAAPQITDEVETVSSLLPQSACCCNAQATRARFRELAPTSNVLHVACHGRYIPSNPMQSGVRMADGWLTAHELFGLHLDSPLVVLSGCDTGRANVNLADEQVGLIRAFFAGGAASLVMSLWPLNDETARLLMQKMYECWQHTPTNWAICRALRQAQLAILDQFPHPAHWAAFVIQARASRAQPNS